jgi:hypothetical protein
MLRFQFTGSNKPTNVILAEKNSGISWATKFKLWPSRFNAIRVGHGGSDPGLKTEMLTDLNREIGVILFSNTELDDQVERAYYRIFEDLWDHAVTLKAAPRSASTKHDRMKLRCSLSRRWYG